MLDQLEWDISYVDLLCSVLDPGGENQMAAVLTVGAPIFTAQEIIITTSHYVSAGWLSDSEMTASANSRLYFVAREFYLFDPDKRLIPMNPGRDWMEVRHNFVPPEVEFDWDRSVPPHGLTAYHQVDNGVFEPWSYQL